MQLVTVRVTYSTYNQTIKKICKDSGLDASMTLPLALAIFLHDQMPSTTLRCRTPLLSDSTCDPPLSPPLLGDITFTTHEAVPLSHFENRYLYFFPPS